jgi:hypothetical protein
MKSPFTLALLFIMPSLFAGATKETALSDQKKYLVITKKKSPVIKGLCTNAKKSLHHISANNVEKKALLQELDGSDILFYKTNHPSKESSHITWTQKELLTLDINEKAFFMMRRSNQVKKTVKHPSERQQHFENLIEELIDGRPTTCISNPNDPQFIVRIFEGLNEAERKTLRVLLSGLYAKEHKTFSTRCNELRKKLVQKCTSCPKGYKRLDETA